MRAKNAVRRRAEFDLTAKDASGNTVIIELKAGTAAPEVIAQILACMSTVAETDKVPVRGILVAGDFHRRVILTARAIPTLTLKRYRFRFSFDPIS